MIVSNGAITGIWARMICTNRSRFYDNNKHMRDEFARVMFMYVAVVLDGVYLFVAFRCKQRCLRVIRYECQLLFADVGVIIIISACTIVLFCWIRRDDQCAHKIIGHINIQHLLEHIQTDRGRLVCVRVYYLIGCDG